MIPERAQLATPEPSALRTRTLLSTLFLFCYIPTTYYYGFILAGGILFDFPSYYYAALMAFEWGSSPYGLNKFHAASAIVGRKVHPYLYPPPSLLAFWPFASFPILEAQAAFLVVSHLCYLGSLWLILTQLTPLPDNCSRRFLTAACALVYILGFDPVLSTLSHGQVNLIVLFFLCLALTGMKKGVSSWLIALPLSVAIVLKTYPVLLLIPLLFRRQYRTLVTTVAFVASFTAIASVYLQTAVWRDWFNQVVPLAGYGSNGLSAGFVWNQSINAFIIRLLMPSEFTVSPLSYPYLAKPIATALAVLLIAVTVLFSFRLSRQHDYRQRWDEEIAAFLLLTFLIAPLSWDHHLVYVLPATTAALSFVLNRGTTTFWSICVVVALILIAWRVPIDDPALYRGWWSLLASMKLYPVIALWLFFVLRKTQPTRRAVLP